MARVSGKTDKDEHLKRVGAAIRDRRNAAAMTQDELAHAAGIDRAHMGKIERGERNVSLLNLLRIAGALNVRTSQILEAADL